VAGFFQSVKKEDDSPAVNKIDRREMVFTVPRPDGGFDPFKPKAKAPNRREVSMVSPNTKAITRNKGWERRVGEPRILEAENRALLGLGSSGQVKSDMIRSGPDRRSESGVRKGKTPLCVDENPVEPGKDRRGLLVWTK
jgi:hypothetical protein